MENNKESLFLDSLHKYGRIWDFVMAGVFFLFPVLLCIIFSVVPDWNGLVNGLIATLPMYWAVGIVETFTYNANEYTEELAKSDTYFMIKIIVNKTPIYDPDNSYIPKGKGAINLLDSDGKTVISKVLFSKWAEVVDSYSDNNDEDEQTRNFGFYRANEDEDKDPVFIKYSLTEAASEFKYKVTYNDSQTTRNNQYKFSTKPVVGTDNSLLNLQSGDIITLIIYAGDDLEMEHPLY